MNVIFENYTMKSSILLLISLIFCWLSPQNLCAQGLKFETILYDFGVIAETGGVVSTTFKFKNEGPAPAVIISAQTTCGCTTPDYSREPVVEGGEGSVTITYDPMYRPGKFSKDVKLFTSSSSSPIVLTIMGDVTEREKSVEEEYPFDMGGGLRIVYNHFALTQVEQGTTKESMVSYINTSDKAISIELRADTRSGYLYNKAPKSIAPGESGFFAIGYDLTNASSYYGSLSDRLDVVVDGEVSRYQLVVTGHATDKFLLKDYNSSGSANINKRFLKFAEIERSSTSARQSFSIENIGVEALNVRRVECAEGVKCSLKAGDKIDAGDIAEIKVWVTPKGYDYGAFSSYITLTLDDAERPIQRVRVTGIVVK